MPQEQKFISVGFKVPYEPSSGIVLPTEPKEYCYWSIIRHAILINSYKHWIEAGGTSKKQFAECFIRDIDLGLYPLLNIHSYEPPRTLTPEAITSQLDWLAQPENQVIVIEGTGKSKTVTFYPNRLFYITSKQKAKESKISYERNKMEKAVSKVNKVLDSLGEIERKILLEKLAL